MGEMKLIFKNVLIAIYGTISWDSLFFAFELPTYFVTMHVLVL